MKITQTRDYSQFISDPTNRPITAANPTVVLLRRVASRKKIYASMKKYGFLPFPILARRSGDKLMVLDGQNRLAVAQELGLPVFYVLTDREDIVIADCAAGQSPWSIADYAGSFANQGNSEYGKLLDFSEKNKIPVAKAATLLNGSVGNGANSNLKVREGRFKVVDLKYANRVANLAAAVCEYVRWGKVSNSLGALSRFVRVPEFNETQFISKVHAHSAYLKNQPNMEAFSTMYEELYNHGARARIPLAFLAREAATKRNPRSRKASKPESI